MGTTKNVFYTSDLHFFHDKVAEIRGFPSSAIHDLDITRNWCEQVNAQDDVYILGDIACDARTTTKALSLISSLPGNKILIAGNHDPFHPKNHAFADWQLKAMSYPTIKAVAPFARRKLAGQSVMLSHFPYYRERGSEAPRDMQYRLRNEGNWLLHGHTHTKEFVTIDILPPQEVIREIHVGLDAHEFKLVNQDQVLDIIKG